MIPRRFFWLFDLTALFLAFLVSDSLAPVIQGLIASKGILSSAWIAALSPEPAWVPQPLKEQIWIWLVAAPPVIIFLEMAGSHGKWLQHSLLRSLLAGPAAAVVGMSLVSLVPLALRNPSIRLSRLLLFSFALLSALGLSGYRYVMRLWYLKRKESGAYAKNTLLVGLPAAVGWMTRYFDENVNSKDYRIMGCLRITNGHSSCRPDEIQFAGSNSGALPKLLGDVSDLGDLLIHKPIHEVIAIQPDTGGEWIPQVIEDCDKMGILLRIVPQALLMGETVRLRMLYPFQALHLPAIILAPPHWDSDALFVKRLIDFILSGLLLVLLSPVYIVIAALIKLTTPHLPIFYKWRVVGQNGVEFTGYKFTTMQLDADKRKEQLQDRNEMSGPVFKIKDDPRVTALGRFLRKFSLNELPQLWSVFKGDMSLVGPRPAFRQELERYDFWHKRKLSIKPGITCLWQVRGRNKINHFDRWVEMDLEYIDNWSLWLDFKILLRTAWVVIAGTGS